MSAPPAKRARLSTNGVAVPRPQNPKNYASIVKRLDRATVNSLLCTAASTHTDIANAIDLTVNRVAEVERKKVVDFDYLSRNALKALNVTYDRLSGSAEYDMAGEAESSVRDCIRTIRKGCPPHANFKTLKSGLETLRVIGEIIILSNNTVSHEVQKVFYIDRILEDTMFGIVNAMTDLERDTLVYQGWIYKLEKLEELANVHCIFEGLGDVVHCIFKGLGDVIQLLEGGGGEDEDEDGKEDEEEDENEEEEED